mgnify:CR=1 FL=1
MGTTRKRAVLESYKHRAAKWVLKTWLQDRGFEVKTEEMFDVDGWKFYPDITIYLDNQIQAFYEVVHTHPVDWKKLSCMQHYCWNNKLEILMHEVDAEWILRQIESPERILCFTFDLNMNKYTEEYNREEMLLQI